MVVVATDQHLFTVDTEVDGTAVRLVLRVGDATPTECGGLSMELGIVGMVLIECQARTRVTIGRMTTTEIPTDLKVTAAIPWRDSEHATPIVDLATIIDTAKRYGHAIDGVLMTTEQVNHFTRAKSVILIAKVSGIRADWHNDEPLSHAEALNVLHGYNLRLITYPDYLAGQVALGKLGEGFIDTLATLRAD